MHLNWKFRFSSPDWKDGGVGGWQTRTPGSSTTKLKLSHLWEWAKMGGGSSWCNLARAMWDPVFAVSGLQGKDGGRGGGEKRGGESKAKNKTGKRESEMQVLEVTQEVYVKFGWISSTNKANKIFEKHIIFQMILQHVSCCIIKAFMLTIFNRKSKRMLMQLSLLWWTEPLRMLTVVQSWCHSVEQLLI